jgi:hypothetical protein
VGVGLTGLVGVASIWSYLYAEGFYERYGFTNEAIGFSHADAVFRAGSFVVLAFGVIASVLLAIAWVWYFVGRRPLRSRRSSWACLGLGLVMAAANGLMGLFADPSLLLVLLLDGAGAYLIVIGARQLWTSQPTSWRTSWAGHVLGAAGIAAIVLLGGVGPLLLGTGTRDASSALSRAAKGETAWQTMLGVEPARVSVQWLGSSPSPFGANPARAFLLASHDGTSSFFDLDACVPLQVPTALTVIARGTPRPSQGAATTTEAPQPCPTS